MQTTILTWGLDDDIDITTETDMDGIDVGVSIAYPIAPASLTP